MHKSGEGSRQSHQNKRDQQPNDQQSLQRQLTNLQSKVAFFEKLTDHVPALIYLLDLENKRNIWSNKTLQDFIGYDPKGMKVLDNDQFIKSVHRDDYSVIFQMLDDFINNKIDQHTSTFRLKDTQNKIHYFYFVHQVHKRDEEGNPLHLLGVAMDITSQTSTDQRMRLFISENPMHANQLLEELNSQQMKILKKLAEGKTYQSISCDMHLSMDGVRYHIRKIYQIMDVHSRSEAVSLALKYGIVTL